MRQHTTPVGGRLVSGTALAAALIAVLFVTAACVATDVGSGSGPTPAPTAAPTGAPGPTAGASDAPVGPIVVDLDIATQHDVAVAIDDRTGAIESASSGTAGDGMSVRWGDVLVESVDPRTIRLTWVGLPIDETLGMAVARDGASVAIDVTQDLPPANSDALGGDRVLVITFRDPVEADDVVVTFPAFTPA